MLLNFMYVKTNSRLEHMFQSQDNISLKMHQIPMLAFMDM